MKRVRRGDRGERELRRGDIRERILKSGVKSEGESEEERRR